MPIFKNSNATFRVIFKQCALGNNLVNWYKIEKSINVRWKMCFQVFLLLNLSSPLLLYGSLARQDASKKQSWSQECDLLEFMLSKAKKRSKRTSKENSFPSFLKTIFYMSKNWTITRRGSFIQGSKINICWGYYSRSCRAGTHAYYWVGLSACFDG